MENYYTARVWNEVVSMQFKIKTHNTETYRRLHERLLFGLVMSFCSLDFSPQHSLKLSVLKNRTICKNLTHIEINNLKPLSLYESVAEQRNRDCKTKTMAQSHLCINLLTFQISYSLFQCYWLHFC